MSLECGFSYIPTADIIIIVEELGIVDNSVQRKVVEVPWRVDVADCGDGKGRTD